MFNIFLHHIIGKKMTENDCLILLAIKKISLSKLNIVRRRLLSLFYFLIKLVYKNFI